MNKTILTLVVLAQAAALSAGPKVSILGDSYSAVEGTIPEGNAVWYFKPPKNQNDVTSDLKHIDKGNTGHPTVAGMKKFAQQVTDAIKAASAK